MSRMHVRDLIKVSGTSESWGYAFNGNSYIKLHFFVSELYKVTKREKDHFGTLLHKLMDATEKYMKNSKCKIMISYSTFE